MASGKSELSYGRKFHLVFEQLLHLEKLVSKNGGWAIFELQALNKKDVFKNIVIALFFTEN